MEHILALLQIVIFVVLLFLGIRATIAIILIEKMLRKAIQQWESETKAREYWSKKRQREEDGKIEERLRQQ